MLELAKDLAPEVVVRIRELCALSDDKALECPVCMDMADNATIFIPCGHNTCSECFARISDPAQAIADGNAAEGRNAQVKCPNCRGIIIPSRVIDHNAFKRVHMPELMSDGLLVEDVPANVETTDDSDSEDEDEDEDDDDEAKVDSKGDLRNFIVRDDEIIEDGTGSEDDDLYRPEHSKVCCRPFISSVYLVLIFDDDRE